MPDEKRERFNLKTMSGIHPGTRTQVFQRVIVDQDTAGDSTAGATVVPNAQLAWYEDAACVLTLDGADEPLLRIDAVLDNESGRAAFWSNLLAELEKRNAHLRVCGTCTHCQETAAVSADGLALGACGFGQKTGADNELARQSLLALACAHWRKRAAQITWSKGGDRARGDELPRSQQIEPAARIATGAGDGTVELDPSFSPKVASQNGGDGKQGRGGLFATLKRLVGRQTAEVSPEISSQSIVERSGVGAGTESCVACQGRIANLGAFLTQTDEGDAQTFSVWRCRNCHTFYLNQWIDRWVRLDNLETEEVYYRLAPSEALGLLHEIEGGSVSAEIFTDFVAGCSELSRQVKHGR